MGGQLDRRVTYAEKAKKLSDREIREFTFVELCDLSYHVREELNSKVGALWGWRLKWIGAGKVFGVLGVIVGLIIAALKAL